MEYKCKSEQESLLEAACLAYIREHRILGIVLEKFIKKYESYGDVIGSVTLGKITIEDREVLEGFFQKNYHGKKQISISSKDLEKSLSKSRFSEITSGRLLELYAKEELQSKAFLRQLEENKWSDMFLEVEKELEHTIGLNWVLAVKEDKKWGYAYLQEVYREERNQIEVVKKALLFGAKVINQFPMHKGKKEYLPVFSTNMTGNPHSFDDKNPLGRYLLQILPWFEQHENQKLFRSLEKKRLYLNVGLLRDDVSNFVVVSGIRLKKQNQSWHMGMEGFYKEGDTVLLSLSMIASCIEVACVNNEIFVVENPAIYIALVNKWKGKKSCFCMNGQPNLSALLLLDLLAKAGVTMYYAGDFDPEGLLIAEKLKTYYEGTYLYWHMGLEDYMASKSNHPISHKSMASLKRLVDEDLLEVKEEMIRCEKAGYQEQILKRYL